MVSGLLDPTDRPAIGTLQKACSSTQYDVLTISRAFEPYAPAVCRLVGPSTHATEAFKQQQGQVVHLLAELEECPCGWTLQFII